MFLECESTNTTTLGTLEQSCFHSVNANRLLSKWKEGEECQFQKVDQKKVHRMLKKLQTIIILLYSMIDFQTVGTLVG